MSDVKLTTVTVDGLSVETTDAGAQAISKLTQELADARKAKEDATKDHEAKMSAKDQELAQKDAAIDDLKGKQLTDADIDQRVNDRADLIATAKQIADQDYTGISDNEIRAKAVAAVIGRDAIDGKSVDYVAARFDILADEANQDGVRKIVKQGSKPTRDSADEAHDAMVTDLANRWKGEAA